jgi:hypothetical protein
MVRLWPGSITITGPDPFGTALELRERLVGGGALDARCADAGWAGVEDAALERVLGDCAGEEAVVLLGGTGTVLLGAGVRRCDAVGAGEGVVDPSAPLPHADSVNAAHARPASHSPAARGRLMRRIAPPTRAPECTRPR